MKMTRGRECYEAVRSELNDPKTKLSDLDSEVVMEAKNYAKKDHMKWPPKPYPWYIGGGWFRHG